LQEQIGLKRLEALPFIQSGSYDRNMSFKTRFSWVQPCRKCSYFFGRFIHFKICLN